MPEQGKPLVITEEMNSQSEWYAAKPTLEELPEFFRHLTQDYIHDYGTIVHAITAAGVATMHAIDRSPGGGITGFQAGCIIWQFITEWMPSYKNKPLRLLDFSNMLYPQYETQFEKTISSETHEWLQTEAKRLLSESDKSHVHTEVWRHWQYVANGIIPFGYSISDER